MQALQLSFLRSGGIVQGSATGSLGPYSGTTSWSFRLPTAQQAKSALSLRLAIPTVQLGTLLDAIGPTVGDLLPSFVLLPDLPLLQLTTSDYDSECMLQ